MKSWVSSAFSDLNSQSTTKPSLSSTSARSKTQKTNSLSSSSSSSSQQKQTLLSNVTNQQDSRTTRINEPFKSPSKPNSNKNEKSQISLSLKYEPVNRADLSIHKNKIDQLSNLLDEIVSKEKGSILLIEGPSGCGKYVTLKVLCKEKNVELVEWDSSSLNLKSLDVQNGVQDYSSEPYESQIKIFTQYLFKSSRYDQLFNTTLSQQNSKKILLVKELPNFAFKDPKVFINLLNEFKRFSKFSLVFSLTQTTYSELNPLKVFSGETRKDLRVLEISFNPIANTFLSKKIEKMSKQENFGFVDKKFLENLCATCNGDLRHAINLLELTSTGHKVQFQKKTTKSKKIGEAISFESGQKDANYSIFRGLGKVLHRKNLDSNLESYCLPNHLKKFKRPCLANDPEDIYDKLPLSSDMILSYLQQNYIDIFNVKSSSINFDDQFDALISISDNFIMSDIINKTSNQFEMGLNTGNQEARLKEISSSVAIRSVLFNFYFNSEHESKSLWMPLFKPFNSKLIESRLKRKKIAKDFINCASDMDQKMIKFLTEMNKEFFTEFIPFMQLKSSHRRPGIPRDNFLQMFFKPEYSQLFSKCNKTRLNQQQTNENDFENGQDEQNENVLLSNEKSKETSNTFKGNYVYEDSSNLKIDDFNF